MVAGNEGKGPGGVQVFSSNSSNKQRNARANKMGATTTIDQIDRTRTRTLDGPKTPPLAHPCVMFVGGEQPYPPGTCGGTHVGQSLHYIVVVVAYKTIGQHGRCLGVMPQS